MYTHSIPDFRKHFFWVFNLCIFFFFLSWHVKLTFSYYFNQTVSYISDFYPSFNDKNHFDIRMKG
jgi:hypothetical protein